tara:strand:+ start:224 stop:430 length:207 start_codon:yes stop_codon:yes gene_type:complete
VKNTLSSITNRISSKYSSEDKSLYEAKSTNINILLNRVRLDKKKESRKKILFTAVTSLGLVLFSVLIF